MQATLDKCRTMLFGFQVPDVGSRTSLRCPAQWIGLKTPVNQVTCGTEYLEAVLARVVVRSARETLCTSMDLEREKHELSRSIFNISSKRFTKLAMIFSSAEEVMFFIGLFVGLSVCLSVSSLTQKVVD